MLRTLPLCAWPFLSVLVLCLALCNKLFMARAGRSLAPAPLVDVASPASHDLSQPQHDSPAPNSDTFPWWKGQLPMQRHDMHAFQHGTPKEDATGQETIATVEASAGGRRKLQQFFSQVGAAQQVGFPFFLDIVQNQFDNVGYAGITRPISTAVDRSLAQSQLCTTSSAARSNLATCNNIPGFNALAAAG